MVVLPVPWNPYEQDFKQDAYPPYAPSLAERHLLGTDTSVRDVLARLVYGFRIAIGFAFIALVASYAIGVTIGCMMGFLGGRFDLVLQRFIEIWSQVPFLYVIMILVSLAAQLRPVRGHQRAVWLDGHHLYMRTLTYKERARDYVMARGPRGRHRADHLPPHSAQHPDDDRHPGAVCRGGQHLHPDGTGLSGLRPGSAHPELGSCSPRASTTWMPSGS